MMWVVLFGEGVVTSAPVTPTTLPRARAAERQPLQLDDACERLVERLLDLRQRVGRGDDHE
jgi:hypothetical protein